MKQKIMRKYPAHTHAHTCKNHTNTTKSRREQTPALCNKKVSLVTNYDTNSLWERIRAWPLLLPKLQSGCKWGRKKWAEPGNGEPLQTCEFQHMYKNLPFYILRSGKWDQHRKHTLKLCFYKICVRGVKLWYCILLKLRIIEPNHLIILISVNR